MHSACLDHQKQNSLRYKAEHVYAKYAKRLKDCLNHDTTSSTVKTVSTSPFQQFLFSA